MQWHCGYRSRLRLSRNWNSDGRQAQGPTLEETLGASPQRLVSVIPGYILTVQVSLHPRQLRSLLVLGVHLDALFLLVRIRHRAEEHVERLFAALIEHLVAGLIE